MVRISAARVDLETMVRPEADAGARPVLVQLMAVQAGFPLYGRVRLAGGAQYERALWAGRGALVSAGLLQRLDLKVGDAIRIGLLEFTIRGVVENPVAMGMYLSPTPRITVDYADVEAAGLICTGGRVSYRWLFKTREGQDAAVQNAFERERDVLVRDNPALGSARMYWGSSRREQNVMTMQLDRIEELYGLAIGDAEIFDLLGRRIEAKVTSIRRLDRRISPMSYIMPSAIVFRPGPLDAAPQLLIGAVRGPAPGPERSRFQRALVEEFLNVTVIDAFDTMDAVRESTRDAAFEVSFLGGLVFLSGALMLVGSIRMTKFQRVYDVAVLKTLGAKKRLIVCIAIIEYGVLGLLAGSIGSAGAMALTWALDRYSLEITWRLMPSTNLVGVAATLLLVVAVGVLASWDMMMKKPIGILRAM